MMLASLATRLGRILTLTALGATVAVIAVASPGAAQGGPSAVTGISSVVVGLGASTPVVSPDGSRVYVANTGAGTVSVVDAASLAVRATITVGKGPGPVAVSADGTQVLVPNSGDATVSVIDATSLTVTATIAVGGAPGTPAVGSGPDSGRAYVPVAEAGTIAVIDMAAASVTATIPVGRNPLTPAFGTGSAAAPLTTRMFVAAEGSVSVIDTQTNQVVATTPGNSGGSFSPGTNLAASAALSQSGYYVFVPAHNALPKSAASTMAILDMATGSPVTTAYSLPSFPVTPVMSLDGTRMFVAGLQGVAIWDVGPAFSATAPYLTPTTRLVGVGSVATVPALNPSGTTLYASTTTGIAVVDTASGTVASVITMGTPGQPTLSPSGDRLYAIDTTRHSLVSVDTATQLAPGRPTHLTIRAHGRNVTATWRAPRQAGAGGISGYTVTNVAPGWAGTCTTKGRTACTFRLRPGAQRQKVLTFSVTARNAVASGAASAPKLLIPRR